MLVIPRKSLTYSVNRETRNHVESNPAAQYIFNTKLMKHQQQFCTHLHESKLGLKEQQPKAAGSMKQFHLLCEWLTRGYSSNLVQAISTQLYAYLLESRNI